MKQRILFLLIIFLFLTHLIFGQDWVLSTTINGSDIEPKYSVIDNSNNIYLYSTFYDTIFDFSNLKSYGVRDLLLAKINMQGQILWYQHIGSDGNDNTGGITLDNNNNVYILGNYFKTCKFNATDTLINTGNGDVFLAKYNSQGIFQWAKRICSSNTNQGSTDLKFDGNNNRLIIAGFFKDSLIVGSTLSDMDTIIGNSFTSNFISAFSIEGNHLWSKSFLATSNFTRFIKTDINSNGYYFGGYFQNIFYLDIDTITSYVPNQYDVFIYKTDFNGNGEWVRRIRGQNTENFKTLATDEYDNVYILGNYNSSSIFVDSSETFTNTYSGNIGGYDTYIGKYNKTGVLQWFLRKGSTAKDIYNDFVVRNNVIYATGYFANQIVFNEDTLRTSDPLNEDAFLAAFNEIGDPIAGVSIQGTDNYNDAGTIVNMGSSSRAYVAGYYKSPQIKIGDSTFYNEHVNKSDLFFAIYDHPLSAVITAESQVTCNGLSNGMLTVTPYFGKPPYTYSWSHNPGLNNPVANGLAAAQYSVTVTDVNNNTSIVTGTVTQPQPLLSNGIPTNPSCYNYNDGQITLTPGGGTTPYAFSWTSPDGSGLNPTGQNQSGLNRGSYILTLRDQNLCTKKDTFVLTQPAKITFGNSSVDTIKIPPGGNGAVNLVVTGGTPSYTFKWNGPGIVDDPSDSLKNLTLGGSYMIQVTDSKTCTGDTSFLVPSDTMLVASISSKTNVDCNSNLTGSATVSVSNGSGDYTYAWRDNLGNPVGVNSPVLSAVPANTYHVLVTDNTNSKTAEATAIISEPVALSTLVNATPLRCKADNSGVISLQVSGGTLPYSYNWQGPGSFTATTEDLVNLASGNYAVTVTDANGCPKSEPPVFVDEPGNILTVSIGLSKSIKCFGNLTGELTANAAGGTQPFKYYWNDPGAQVTQLATGLQAGKYKVSVTDLNSCLTVSDEYTLSQPEEIKVADVIYTRPTCVGNSDGSINPLISYEIPLFSFEWNTGATEQILDNVPAGDYSLTIKDINTCTKDADFSLKDTLPVVIQSISHSDASCFGYKNGVISINASGGTGTLGYSVLGGLFPQASPVFDTMPANSYTVKVLDANNCESPDSSVTINQPAGVDISSELAEDVTCFGGNDGNITIVASGGAGNLEYSVDDGQTYVDNGGLFSNLNADTYTIKIRDTAGCEYPGSLLAVTEPPSIDITNEEYENISCAGSGDGSISITASGGTGNLVYSINNGTDYVDNNGLFTSLNEGIFNVRVRDADNCDTSGMEITIINPDTLLIDTVGVVHVTSGNDGSITLESSGGTAPVTYIAIPMASDSLTNNTGTFTNLAGGDYRLYAMDINQCTSNTLNITLLGEGSKAIIIYDAFSPNADGKNDVWNIGNISKFPNCKIKIYNSWGTPVFSSDGYAEPWDGTYNGNALPSGTYYYVINLGDGSEKFTGPVNIVK